MAGAQVEQRQARAVAALEQAAARRAEATAALEAATDHVRQAVLDARGAGVSVRRTAQIGQVSPSTVDDWTRQARAAADYRAARGAGTQGESA